MKTGQFYKQFVAKNGKAISLRSSKWEDLDPAVTYVNELVIEGEQDKDFGIPFEKRITREYETRWLADNLVKMEEGVMISVVAESDGVIVGHTSVERGLRPDNKYHGVLGISVAKEFRDVGVGRELIKTALEESRKIGIKIVTLRVFANNPRAIHVYEKTGFRQVGRIPNVIFRGGRFIDEVIMAVEL